MALNRVDSAHGESEPPCELQGLLAFAAANVNGGRSRRQMKIPDQVVEHLGSAWVQARIEGRLELLFEPRVIVVGLLEREVIIVISFVRRTCLRTDVPDPSARKSLTLGSWRSACA